MVTPCSAKVAYHWCFLSLARPSVSFYRALGSPFHHSFLYRKFPRRVSKHFDVLWKPCQISCSGLRDPCEYPVDACGEHTDEINLGEAVMTSKNEIIVEVEKAGRNYRRIRSKAIVRASLEAIWSVLTDYEKLSDIVPSLVVSKLVEKEGNRARLYQVGEQSFPLGFKFSAKVVLDCYEKQLEILSNGRKRDIEFKMIEGDFTLYEGKWSIEQTKEAGGEQSTTEESVESCLWYYVDVKAKPWLPVQLIEGRLCKEIESNLSSMRDAAQKVINEPLII